MHPAILKGGEQKRCMDAFDGHQTPLKKLVLSNEPLLQLFHTALNLSRFQLDGNKVGWTGSPWLPCT